MKDGYNHSVPPRGGRHPGVWAGEPLPRVQHCLAAQMQEWASFHSTVWLQAMARGRHPDNQTRPAVCPTAAVPDTPWGASHYALKQLSNSIYAGLWHARGGEGEHHPLFTLGHSSASLHACHSLPQCHPGVLPKTSGGTQRTGQCARVCPACSLQHIAGSAADPASLVEGGRSRAEISWEQG